MFRRVATASLAMLLLAVPSQSLAASEGESGQDNGAPGAEVTEGTEEAAASESGAAVSAQAAEEEPAGKLSGRVFFDWYGMVSNHRDDVEGQTGFWFRRIYLTYDRKLGGGLDARLRFEMNSAGNFTSGGKMNTFVKDAWVRWRGDQTSVIVGMSGTPTWGLVEPFWGYRAVEKTPLDLQKWGSSRDIGIAVKGSLGADKKIRYHVMGGNGNSTNAETSRGKAVYGSLAFDVSDDLVVEVLAEYNQINENKSRANYQVFGGYDTGTTRVGLQYVHQTTDETGKDKRESDLMSVFWVQKLSEKFKLLLRGDRMFEPNPDGNKIQYLPFDPTARAFFVLAGVDFDYGHNVHVIPNVEYISYRAVDSSEDPRDDLVVRVTFFWRF